MVRITKVLTGAALGLIALASRGNAQDSGPSAEAIAAAHNLVIAQDQGSQMKKISEAIARMTQDQLSNSDPGSAKFASVFLRNALSPDSPGMKKFIEEMEQLQVRALAADLSTEEMKQVASFLQSDAYKKYTATNFKVLASAAPIVAELQKSMQIAAYEELTKQQPKNAGAWNGLCWITITAGGDPNKALEQCNTAIRLDPKFANAFDSRGLVYLKLGDFDRALADYEAALRLCPRLAGAAYGRGIAKIKRGDFAAGSEDIIMAKTANQNLVAQFAAYGVK
jgi:tetratricopeptide (TPR) repeat protein